MTINVVTEDDFPKQYAQDGRLVGPAYEVVKATLARAGYHHEASVLPWSRAYKTALAQPNTLIFSIVRTKQREPLFHWIGEIHELHYVLIKLTKRTDVKLASLDSLGRNRIGVIRDSAIHLHFKNLGLDYHLFVSHNNSSLFNLLLKERVELIPRNKLTLPFDCLKRKMDCSQFTIVSNLEEFNKGFYLAMSKSTDPAALENIKEAFLQLQQSGQVDSLMRHTYSEQSIAQFKAKLAAQNR